MLIHPGVAEAGRAEAGPAFQEAVDAALAATWATVMQAALENYGKNPDAGAVIVRAGLAGFPYLSRRREWEAASYMLEQTASIDHTPATLASILPRMRRVVQASVGTDNELKSCGLLANTLRHIGRWEEAEQEFRTIIEEAKQRSEFRTVSSTAIDLANLLRSGSRLNEALSVIEQATDHNRRAGFGPWMLLAEEVQLLQIQLLGGENDLVVRRVSWTPDLGPLAKV